jgi:hypothetical protein
MTTFKCRRSGNFVSFTNVNDIEGMRKHEGYVEIIDVEAPKALETKSPETPTKEVLTLRKGRPPKQQMPSFLQE